ncbi:hypothetical protein D3C81_1444370 [compost metagenome]
MMFRLRSFSPPSTISRLLSRSAGVVPKPPVSSATTATSSSALAPMPDRMVEACSRCESSTPNSCLMTRPLAWLVDSTASHTSRVTCVSRYRLHSTMSNQTSS